MNTFTHIPVLMTEVLAGLNLRPGGVYLDGTIGGGGHAAAILKAIGPTGWLWGIDRDGTALTAAAARLEDYRGRFEMHAGSFDQMEQWVAPASCDGVLLDLGVSSPQLDLADRGFSFQADGPLDMRMDRTQVLTAADVVNTWDEDALANVLFQLGEERQSRRLARAIVQQRQVRPFRRTRELAQLIEQVLPRGNSRIHPATKTFQALRMVVNDELGQLERGLAAATHVLRAQGRLAVICFHSLEARAVKQFGDFHSRDYEFDGEVDVPELRRPRVPELRWISRRGIGAGTEELQLNPRARSAQLRLLEKLPHGS